LKAVAERDGTELINGLRNAGLQPSGAELTIADRQKRESSHKSLGQILAGPPTAGSVGSLHAHINQRPSLRYLLRRFICGLSTPWWNRQSSSGTACHTAWSLPSGCHPGDIPVFSFTYYGGSRACVPDLWKGVNAQTSFSFRCHSASAIIEYAIDSTFWQQIKYHDSLSCSDSLYRLIFRLPIIFVSFILK
jgi:hypothetical protein